MNNKERIFDAKNIKLPNELSNVTYQHLHIDSSDKLYDNNTSSNYSIQLRERFSYVTSVELIDAHIPINDYTITQYNNMIYYQETNDQIEDKTYTCCEIPQGKYEILKLLNVIKYEMANNSINHSKYSCKLNEHTNKITIESSSDVFNLIFTESREIVGESGISTIKSYNEHTKKNEEYRVKVGNTKAIYIKNSIGRTLGFLPINLNNHHSYTGDLIFNLKPFDYISLHISTDSGEVFKQVISSNDATNDAFAVLTLHKEPNKIFDLGKYIKHFNPPINFTRLNIKFLTSNGDLYDFKGQDNYIVLEVSKVFGNQKVSTLSQLY